MARSPAVWVVIDDATAMPVAAFTVKHELCTWLWKYENPQSISHLHGWKVSDGVRQWIGRKVPEPLPLDLLFLREEGRKLEEAKNAARNRQWE